MRSVLLASLRGSPLTFNPAPGTVSDEGATSAEVTITASQPVAWVWSSTGNLPTCNVTSGQVATSITFTLRSAPTHVGYPPKDSEVTLSAAGQDWTIELIVDGTSI